jgi:hypothetical protein
VVDLFWDKFSFRNTAFVGFFELGYGRTARDKSLAPLFALTEFIVRHAVLNLFIFTATQCDFGRAELLVNDFVCAAGHFGFAVFDNHFAVFLASDEGFGVALLFGFGGFAVAPSSVGFEEGAQFAVQGFGGVLLSG